MTSLVNRFKSAIKRLAAGTTLAAASAVAPATSIDVAPAPTYPWEQEAWAFNLSVTDPEYFEPPYLGFAQSIIATDTTPIRFEVPTMYTNWGGHSSLKFTLLEGDTLDDANIIAVEEGAVPPGTGDGPGGYTRSSYIGVDFNVPMIAGQTYTVKITCGVDELGQNCQEGDYSRIVLFTGTTWEGDAWQDAYTGGHATRIGEYYQQNPQDDYHRLLDLAFRVTPAVPEPATYALMAGGLVAVAGAAFAKRRREENAVAANTNETQHGAALDAPALAA